MHNTVSNPVLDIVRICGIALTQGWANYGPWATSGLPMHFIQCVTASCTANGTWTVFTNIYQPFGGSWLCTGLCLSVCNNFMYARYLKK